MEAEICTLPSFGYDISFLQNKEHFTILAASDKAFVEILSGYLDKGEAEAIALAKEVDADLLLIDAVWEKKQG